MLIPPDSSMGAKICVCVVCSTWDSAWHMVYAPAMILDCYREEEVASFVHIQYECEKSAIAFFSIIFFN